MSRLLKKVNADESCDNYESESALRAALPWCSERVTYIATRHDVSRNAARTLILKEVGKSGKEIAALLYVTRSTIQKYIDELCDKIHINAVAHISYKRDSGVKYDVWGSGEAEPVNVTTQKEQIDPKFRDREKPLNKGVPLSEIPKDLITLDSEVEI